MSNRQNTRSDELTPLSMTTDYVTGLGSPEPYLKRIAEAGYTHVHWCHQWNTDFVYAPSEIAKIGEWLHTYGLTLLDLHASAGVEKAWLASEEYRRLAGIDLVRNRLEMTARLGGDVIIMHVPAAPTEPAEADAFWDTLRRSLDALQPVSLATGVRIAIENGGGNQFATLVRVLEQYGPEFLGLCYDSGHGNVAGDGLDYLDRVTDRLISVHLHDNNGLADQHRPIFSGTIDWTRLSTLLARSSYHKPLSFELSIRLSGYDDETALLAQAHQDGLRLTSMVAQAGTR